MAASKSTRRTTYGTTKNTQKYPVSGFRKEIWKPPLLQPSIYEQLYLLNRHAQEMVETLKAARGEPGISKEMSAYCQALVQEVCSLASQDILESMNDKEIKNALRFSRLRKRYEKRLLA